MINFISFKITSSNTGSCGAPLLIFRGWHLETQLVLEVISNHVYDRSRINSKIISKATSKHTNLTLPTWTIQSSSLFWFIDITLGTYFNFAVSTFSPVARIIFLACLLVFPQRKVKLKVSSPSHRRMETWIEI